MSVRNSLPFLVATWIIWTVLSHAMQLDGFRGGWRFPAVVAHLCFGVLFVMAILLAGAYLTSITCPGWHSAILALLCF